MFLILYLNISREDRASAFRDLNCAFLFIYLSISRKRAGTGAHREKERGGQEHKHALTYT